MVVHLHALNVTSQKRILLRRQGLIFSRTLEEIHLIQKVNPKLKYFTYIRNFQIWCDIKLMIIL